MSGASAASRRLCVVCGSREVGPDWRCPNCGHAPARDDTFVAFAPEIAPAQKGFDERFFAELAAIEGEHFWFRARNELIAHMLHKHERHLGAFLEIGCGTGFVLQRVRTEFPTAELTGSDIFVQGLHVAQRRVPSATFYQMDARMLPFHEAFNAIGAFDVLEHIVDDRTVVAQVHRALKPGGHFMATVPQHPGLWSRQDVQAHHVRRYTRGRLLRMLTECGFDIVEVTSFVSLLLPAMLASRLRLDNRSDAIEGLEAVRVPTIVNSLAEMVMWIERGLLRLGASFPAGGSLIVVARRPFDAAPAA